MYHEATEQVGVDGINLAQNRAWWQVLVYILWTFIDHTTWGISWLTGELPALQEYCAPNDAISPGEQDTDRKLEEALPI